MNEVLAAVLLLAASQPVQHVDVALAIEQARAAFAQIEPEDRPVAVRNYANILVDVSRCNDAVAIFAEDPELEPDLIHTSVIHAVGLFELSCAAKLASLVIDGSEPSGKDTVRYAGIRMYAGAVLRATGDLKKGEIAIEAAEAALSGSPERDSDGARRQNLQTLWTTRNSMLRVYVGTSLHDPALLRYGRELAADPNVASWQQNVGLLRALSVAGRTDLLRDITANMSSRDRTAVTRSLEVSPRQNVIDVYGMDGVPHCPGAITDDNLETSLERPRGPARSVARPGAMGAITRIHQELHMQRLRDRCPDPLD